MQISYNLYSIISFTLQVKTQVIEKLTALASGAPGSKVRWEPRSNRRVRICFHASFHLRLAKLMLRWSSRHSKHLNSIQFNSISCTEYNAFRILNSIPCEDRTSWGAAVCLPRLPRIVAAAHPTKLKPYWALQGHRRIAEGTRRGSSGVRHRRTVGSKGRQNP